MTLDWPTCAVIVASLASACVALKATLPYVVGQSSAKVQAAALKAVNERLNAVEAHLASGGRKFPGRLG